MSAPLEGRELVEKVSSALQDALDLTIIADPMRMMPAVQVREGCAGIASWALGALYRAGNGVALIDVSAAATVLVACPEHLAAWNLRKRGLSSVDEFEKELRFNELILRRAPKSAEAWAHRTWVLTQVELTSERLKLELNFARIVAGKTFANYHAGVHRVRMLRSAASCDFEELVTWELSQSRTFLGTHPTDPSAWNAHRVAVSAARDSVVDDEGHFVSDMVQRYPTSQSIAIHAKWWNKERSLVV